MNNGLLFNLVGVIVLVVLLSSCEGVRLADTNQRQSILQEEESVKPKLEAESELSDNPGNAMLNLDSEIAATPLLDRADLTAYQWENRLLLVFAPMLQDSSYRDLIAAYEGLGAELLARNMLWFHILAGEQDYVDECQRPLARLSAELSAALKQRYNPDNVPFRVVLIGKDGGVKHTMDEALLPAELFSIIDAMPMRQQEMKTQSD